MSGALTGLVDTTGPPSGVGELLFQSNFAHELQDLERKKCMNLLLVTGFHETTSPNVAALPYRLYL